MLKENITNIRNHWRKRKFEHNSWRDRGKMWIVKIIRMIKRSGNCCVNYNAKKIKIKQLQITQQEKQNRYKKWTMSSNRR